MKNKQLKFAGVGSREAPEDIISIIENIGEKLSERGWLLRSGAANGCDAAFEKRFFGAKEIFLPWKNFNNHKSEFYNISNEAYDLASTIHPAWNKLKDYAKKLHCRNCYQVLGYNLDDPVDLLICWTKNGEKIGGTRTAIVLAEKYNIPIINLFNNSLISDKVIEIEERVQK